MQWDLQERNNDNFVKCVKCTDISPTSSHPWGDLTRNKYTHIMERCQVISVKNENFHRQFIDLIGTETAIHQLGNMQSVI